VLLKVLIESRWNPLGPIRELDDTGRKVYISNAEEAKLRKPETKII
jgi:hypothetical protein